MDGATEGATEGVMDSSIEGAHDGLIDGSTDGLTDGIDEPNLGPTVGIDGAEVSVSEGGPEMHVDRPEPAQAGYTQAGVEAKDPVPNEIPTQFSMITIVS